MIVILLIIDFSIVMLSVLIGLTVCMKAILTLNLKNLQIKLVVYMIFMFPYVLACHVQKNVLGTLEM